MLYVELLERLGNRCCRTIHCETQGQALDRAADAAVVIVNLDVAGGAALLCRRLRAEPSTASVPIILRAPSEQRVPDVDRRVEIDDFERLIQAIQHCVPSLAEAAATMISEQDDAAETASGQMIGGAQADDAAADDERRSISHGVECPQA